MAIQDQLSLLLAMQPQAGPQPSALSTPDLLGGIQQPTQPSWIDALAVPMAQGMGQAPLGAPLLGGVPQDPLPALPPSALAPAPQAPLLEESPLVRDIKQMLGFR